MEIVRADFHTHTTFSDSSISPKKLIQALLDADVQYAAITDHDSMKVFEEGTLEGIAEELRLEFSEREKRLFHLGSLILVSGIELSTCHDNQNQHLVGLGMRPITERDDCDYLKKYAEERNDRIRRMFEEIEEKRKAKEGLYLALGNRPLSLDEFISEIGSAVPTRLHIGKYLWEHYRFGGNPRQAMNLAVNRSLSSYNFNKETMSTVEGIQLIHKYGGVAIVPHLRRQSFSGIVERGPLKLGGVLRTLKQEGVDGIELNPSDELNPMYIRIARELDLLQSIGTDDHGTNGPTYYGSSQDRTQIEISSFSVRAMCKKLQLND